VTTRVKKNKHHGFLMWTLETRLDAPRNPNLQKPKNSQHPKVQKVYRVGRKTSKTTTEKK
jgi:hypothetical protein